MVEISRTRINNITGDIASYEVFTSNENITTAEALYRLSQGDTGDIIKMNTGDIIEMKRNDDGEYELK